MLNKFCLATFISGNFAISLNNILSRQGFNCEVTATPCRIANSGCGYCIKFPEQYLGVLPGIARENRIALGKIYSVEEKNGKKTYIEIPFR